MRSGRRTRRHTWRQCHRGPACRCSRHLPATGLAWSSMSPAVRAHGERRARSRSQGSGRSQGGGRRRCGAHGRRRDCGGSLAFSASNVCLSGVSASGRTCPVSKVTKAAAPCGTKPTSAAAIPRWRRTLRANTGVDGQPEFRRRRPPMKFSTLRRKRTRAPNPLDAVGGGNGRLGNRPVHGPFGARAAVLRS